jgi:hypothetical protein
VTISYENVNRNKRIESTLNKGAILTAFVCLLVSGLFVAAAETEEKFLGDESDGSRAIPIHRIPLYPENEFGQKGEKIRPDAEFPLPFSTRYTCIECHNYDLVKKGWHFNYIDVNVPAGRPGQPWIYFDSKLCVQIPLSYRNWPGTFRPEQIGLTDFKFTKIFGRHTPGGGPGEVEATQIDDIGRQLVSGKLEINCLACHNANYGLDMGGEHGYSMQVTRENFRWAATASSEFASVTGWADQLPATYDPFMPDPSVKDAPTVTYRKEAFDDNNDVLFQIVREIPDSRCYYCHSNLYETNPDGKTEKWTQDEDIHLKSGLKCVDCHRSGIEHNTIRGYPGEVNISQNPMAAVSSCEGCHLTEDTNEPGAGRLGAPIPTHAGIPTVHFDRLTCTACHSGPWPGYKTILTKTSRAHKLGAPNVNKAPETLPHIFAPVFARREEFFTEPLRKLSLPEDRKIAPYKMIWPVYWGVLEDDSVQPIEISIVEKVIGGVFADIELSATGDWPRLSKEEIVEGLKSLNSAVGAKAVYVSGGKLYSLDDSGEIKVQENHPAAQPYLWPIAHNVRPAAQSLGVRYCTDCHATNAPFFFGDVTIDSPVVAEQSSVENMVEFLDVRPFYTKAFAFSFLFRPWLKIISLISCAVIAMVLLLYALKALGCVVKVFSGNNH